MFTMRQKKAVTKELQNRYQKARKKEKIIILNEFTRLTGYNRYYTSQILIKSKILGYVPIAGEKKKYDDQDVLIALKKLWKEADDICSKRLAPFLSEFIPVMEKYGEIRLDPKVREKLLTISAATIDRLLAPIRKRLPFAILGFDLDNGSEFINHHLIRYCEEEKITFTRARPYRKNDSCYIEQKTWSVIRRTVVYGRYDTEEELRIFHRLYGYLRCYVNFFQSIRKLVKKERVGSRIKKQYDVAQTPFRRVLASSLIPEEIKMQLQRQYAMLNPAELKREMTRLQNHLYKSNILKQNQDKETALGDKSKNSFEYIST